ncbi:efflux RND transporter permease subunit [Rhizosphaericola mali]|uniref:Efflux RND transporter permease subunit n=1 Tax=Rhizosphaericola mali TaxID=2545455 RepID=A0A5P2G7R4_9BACT|nr:efflux RND transporter permease subunit [Rhizosphaericola mali]QES89243.1 efflux RND transporter permease subunit [Rhizosphaericola mali]
MEHKKSNMIDWCLQHKAVPLSVAFILVILGFYGLRHMSRNEFPEFTIRQGLVIGSYPGASSSQVEEQLTTKVEKYLFSFNEVNKAKTYSYSRDGLMYIFVEVSEHINDADTKIFWNKLKNGLLVYQQTSLPKEVRGIMVNSDFGATSAVLLAVQSKTRPYKDLQKQVDDIEDRLRQIPAVAKISHSGDQEQQIGIYVDNNKLIQYGVSIGSLMQVLNKEGAIAPGGELKGKTIDRPIYLSTFYKSASDLPEQIIKSDNQGNVIKLKDVATIKPEYPKPTSFVTTNGVKSIVISMEMVPGKNIVEFGEKVDEKLDAIKKQIPSDIILTKLANQPVVVDESISHFMKEFAFALIGVVIVAMLLLPFSIASVAAATIPITIACTLAIMYLFGIELDTVTLAALIVVLGIVVDDPIVVIDNHVEKLDAKMSLKDAAISSAKELFPSVFTATLAISATFAPLIFFMTGTARDFISTFPLVIIIALTLSLIISMVIVPFFNTKFIKKGLHKEGKKKKSSLDYVQDFFNKHINNAIEHWGITLVLGILAVLGGLFMMAKLPQMLFPKVERNQLAIEIYLPNGYSLNQTDSVVKKMETIMSKDNRIESYASFIGTSSPRFHTLYAPNLPAKNYAQILVNTTSEETTEDVLADYEKNYSNRYPDAYIRMKQLTMVNAQAPIEIRLFGYNIDTLKAFGGKISAIADSIPYVTWVRTDYENLLSSVDLDIKKDDASRIGISKEDISNTVAMNMEGIDATTVWDGDYSIPVKLKTANTDSAHLGSLLDLSVVSQQTKTVVPLRMVANLKSTWNQGQIAHRNGMKTLTVRVDINKDKVPEDILKQIQTRMKNLVTPNDVTIGYGGEHELQEENMGPMGLSLLMSIIIITLILIWHFKSVKHAMLSITTMPLALFGASGGLLLMGYPFGFTSFIGLLALCGIVVRNGIILIDFADEMRFVEGMSVKQAAIHSAERRMRPIFLTSSAAAVGVIPMIISRSTLWGPLGTVICFGLIGAMIFTLFVLPVLYWLFFRKEEAQNDEANSNAVLVSE